MLPVHQRLIHWLEERGDLDRALEFLPTDTEIDRRFADGLGLKSPEFSVLVAYAKLALKEDLLPSELPDDPWFQATLTDYFPAGAARAVRRRAGRAPAAPRDHHQLGGQLDGQPRRHHLRLPGDGGDRRDAGADRPGVRGLPRDLRPAELRPRGRGARQRRVHRRAEPALPRVPAADRPLDALVPDLPPVAARRRQRGRPVRRGGRRVRPADPRPAQGRRAEAPAAQRRRAREGRRARRRWRCARRACSTSSRCSTSSTSPPTRGRPRPTSRRSTSCCRSGSASTRCSPGSPTCRATTAGTRWPVAPCATTCMPCWRASCAPSSTRRRRVRRRWRATSEWAKANAESLARARTALSGIERLDKPNIAALSVALRTLRSVIRSGAATS